MELPYNSSLAIDGAIIRRIREEKRLTQLYVSKVVGVTTDTVSRWENRRYPTIRRDNAIKLAEALEVDLEEILKKEKPVTEAQSEAPAGLPQQKKRWSLLLAALCLIIVAAIFFIHSNGYLPPQLEARRLVSPYAAPGSRVLVRVKVDSDKPLKGMILREEFPRDWTLVEADPPTSSLDNVEGMARWIFRNPPQPLIVSYMLEVPDDAALGTKLNFSGELIANPDGRRFETSLETAGQMEVKPLHWADTNGNQVIDDLEILEVSDVIDEAGRLHLGWEQIEKLWDAGGYRWDYDKGEFVPRRPPPAEQPVEPAEQPLEEPAAESSVL